MINLCKECEQIYKNYKSNLFKGSCEYRPLFCMSCEKRYCEDAYNAFMITNSIKQEEK